MQITVTRKKQIFSPDSTRVIARFLYLDDDRSADIIRKVLAMPEAQVKIAMSQVLRGYARRHRNISRIFERHFDRLAPIFDKIEVNEADLSSSQTAPVGSYFTMEYSIESAAFFNRSIVEHPDQSELRSDEKRVIFSFRATGEGHISSVVFRSGILDRDNNLMIEPVGKMLAEADKIIRNTYNKKSFRDKLHEIQHHPPATAPLITLGAAEIQVPEKVITTAISEKKDEMVEEAKVITPDFILDKLGDSFTYGELMRSLGAAIKDLS